MTKKTALIVDDSPVVRQLLIMAVENLGFDTDEAEDGILAFAKCVVSMPDVVFIDWNMPNMNGIELLKKIRGYDNGHVPKIVFCTVESDPSNIDMAMTLGADDYIVKPFTRTMIANVLRKNEMID